MVSFINATIISIIYLLFRFFEMRIVLKDNKPLKQLLRDALLVYISVIVGEFIIEQLAPIASSMNAQPSVFVNEPDF